MINGILLVCFYGPESTGKTVMAQKMAQRYQTEWVPEVAREIITSNNFNREDIINIGRAQTERVFFKARKANRILFCDTDLITTQIYSRHYLGVVPPVLYELEKMITYDRYLLFDIDVPWVRDGLRDLGSESQRKMMFETFKQELVRRHIDYRLIQGSWQEREDAVVQEIDLLLKR
jgi:HTH-type transcriptional repressor of NAD biosynthesis genes